MIRRPVAFLASGQGSQFAGMGVPQFENDIVFHNTMKALLTGPRLSRILNAWLKGSQEVLARSAYTQPLLVALGIASARTLSSHGIHPSALLGHSAGEFALAVFAGLIDDEATRVALERRSEILKDGPSGQCRPFERFRDNYIDNSKPRFAGMDSCRELSKAVFGIR